MNRRFRTVGSLATAGIAATRSGRGHTRSTLAAAMAVGLLLTFAGIASAHTPSASLTCEGGLKVDLSLYETAGANTVSVSIDGVAVAGSPFTFSDSYSNTWPVAPATTAHTAKVVVLAWDDPTGSNGWSKTFDLSIDACQQPTATPVPTATPTAKPTATPKPTGTVEGNTGVPEITPPPTDTLGNASTGTGSGLPMILAAVAALILAVLFVTPARKRSRR